MRLRSGSTGKLSSIKEQPGATEPDSEIIALAEVSRRERSMDNGTARSSRDAGASRTPQGAGHRKTVMIMGLPLSPELVAISLGENPFIVKRFPVMQSRLCPWGPRISDLGQILNRRLVRW